MYCLNYYNPFSNSLIWSLSSAAFSNSMLAAYLSISSVNLLISSSMLSSLLILYLAPASSIMLALIESLTDFCIVFGVIQCSLLYSSCIRLLLFVSEIAFSIDSVSSSAYIITFPSVFLAARPIV